MKRCFPALLVIVMILYGEAACAENTEQSTMQETEQSTMADAEQSAMQDMAERIKTAAAVDEQMGLLYDLSKDYAAEFELGAWDIELDVEPAGDIREDLIPDTENAVAEDLLPEEYLEAKFFMVCDRYETDGSLIERLIPGSLYVRIPESNRASSLEEADAVLYLTETYEKRSDYIGEAYNRVYQLYAAWIGSDEVFCINRTVMNPPQSGMGILTGDRLDPEQLWTAMSSAFPATVLTADYPDGSVSFRMTGSGCCVTGVEGDFPRFEVPAEVDGVPVIGIESISNSSIEELILPEGIVYISGNYALDCSSLTDISFPSSLRRITGEGVFERTKITSLEFQPGLEEIGEDSIPGGGLLETIILPDTVRTLGNGFLAYGLTGTWAALPEGLTRVPSEFLTSTNKVECVYLPGSIEEFGINILNSSNSTRTYAPEGSAAALWAAEQGEPYTPCDSAENMPHPEFMNEGDYSFTIVEGEAILEEYTGSDADVVVPDKLGGCPVSVIKQSAFYRNETLKSLRFPESVRMFELFCISGCESLDAVYVPGNPEEVFYFINQCENCTVYSPEASPVKQEAEKREVKWEEWDP